MVNVNATANAARCLISSPTMAVLRNSIRSCPEKFLKTPSYDFAKDNYTPMVRKKLKYKFDRLSSFVKWMLNECEAEARIARREMEERRWLDQAVRSAGCMDIELNKWAKIRGIEKVKKEGLKFISIILGFKDGTLPNEAGLKKYIRCLSTKELHKLNKKLDLYINTDYCYPNLSPTPGITSKFEPLPRSKKISFLRGWHAFKRCIGIKKPFDYLNP